MNRPLFLPSDPSQLKKLIHNHYDDIFHQDDVLDYLKAIQMLDCYVVKFFQNNTRYFSGIRPAELKLFF